MSTTATTDYALRILLAGDQPLALFAVLIVVSLCVLLERKQAKPIFRRSSLWQMFTVTALWSFGFAYYIHRDPLARDVSEILFARYLVSILVYLSLILVFEYRSIVTGFSVIGALLGHYMLTYCALASGSYTIYQAGSSDGFSLFSHITDRQLRFAACHGVDMAIGLSLFFIVGQFVAWIASWKSDNDTNLQSVTS